MSGKSERRWRRSKRIYGAVAVTVAAAAWVAALTVPTRRPASLRVLPPDFAGAVQLLALGDTGTGTDAQRQVARAMSRHCLSEACNGVLMLGDNFYPYGVSSVDDAGWLNKFEAIYDQPGLAGLRFYPVLGNHDYGPSSLGSKEAQLVYSSLPVQRCGAKACEGSRYSDKWTFPSRYYEARFGPVHVFALDTQFFLGTNQAEEMANAVRSSDAPWKVVIGHHPVATSGYHAADGWLARWGVKRLVEKPLCAGAHLYLSGHDHDLEYLAPDESERCRGAAYAISGAGAQVRKAKRLNRPLPRRHNSRFFDDTQLGFASIHATPSRLHLRFIDVGGAVLFETTIAGDDAAPPAK